MEKHYWIIVITPNEEIGVKGRKIAVETDIDNPEEVCYYACSVCLIEDEEYVMSHAEPTTKENYEYYKMMGLPTSEL
jgi:hypothetical protein